MALLLYIVINLFYSSYVLKMFCFAFVWCPCMAINVLSVQHNGGFLHDIILLTLFNVTVIGEPVQMP